MPLGLPCAIVNMRANPVSSDKKDGLPAEQLRKKHACTWVAWEPKQHEGEPASLVGNTLAISTC